MEKSEIKIKGGTFIYKRVKKEIFIERYKGVETVVSVPSRIEELPVAVIGKKAFLSHKKIKKIILPESIREIGDWAFARCSSLESMIMPKPAYLGRGLFLECGKLKEIHFLKGNEHIEEQPKESLPFLFAAVPVMLDAEYLFVPEEAGTEQWLQKWDARMLTLLRKNDQEGYTKVILCGEEDYGNSPEDYAREKRKAKVRLAFLRLLHPYRLSENIEKELQEYLVSHTKGCDTEEAWEVLLMEHGEEADYFQLFARLGCVTEENFQDILGDIKEGYAEMKAFFIRYKEEHIGYRDIFEDFILE